MGIGLSRTESKKCNNKDLKCTTFEKAYVIPQKGVFESNGNFVPYTCKRIYGTSDWKENPDLDLIDKNIQYSDETVVYLGYIRLHYGHFLVDSCGRMWAVKEMLKYNYKFVFVLDESDLRDFIKMFLSGLGIEEQQYELINKPKQFKDVIIPELSFYPGISINKEFWTRPFNNIIDKWNYDTGGIKNNKLYLSQTHYICGGHRYGEQKIEYIFRNNGFKIVYPEEISLKEQVLLYNNADMIVCTNGTLAHNIVWMRDKSQLVILNRLMEKTYNEHQLLLNKIKDVNVINIDSCFKLSLHDIGCMKLTKALKAWMKANNLNYRTSMSVKIHYLIEVMCFTFFRLRHQIAKWVKRNKI